MEKTFEVSPIGRFYVDGEETGIRLNAAYAPALRALEGFGHVVVLWWFHQNDDPALRAVLEAPCPYKRGPAVMGTFATRSPYRPNPIGMTVSQVLAVDPARGTLRIAYTDALDGTPVLDIKPYTPSLDRVERPQVPAWCAHWPDSLETSEDFDWVSEFNF